MFKEIRSSFGDPPLTFAILSIFFFGLLSTSLAVPARAQPNPTTPEVILTARLMGEPINGVRPRGAAAYAEFQNGVRNFTVAVDRVRLMSGTMLDVAVDGESVGQIRVRFGFGFVRLSTSSGDNVPSPSSGSTVVISKDDRIVLAGTLTAPPAPPASRLFAPLEGAAVNGRRPRGVAHYAEFGGDNPEEPSSVSQKLAIFVHRVHLPAGTSLNVVVDGTPVGNITLNGEGNGGLRLNSENGDIIPEISVGSEVTVNNGDATILAGTFQEFDRPVPPRFRRNRFFGGRISGRQMVPSVETLARGKVALVMNIPQKKIAVKYAFRGLSSDQTSATLNGPAHRGETGETIFELNLAGGTRGVSGVQVFDVTPEQMAQIRTGLWYIQIGSEQFPDGEIRGQIRSRHRRDRFLGDDRADIAVYRSTVSTFFVKNGDGYLQKHLGTPGSKPVSGDFDGDGTTDFAVFSDGTWSIERSSDGGSTVKQFGSPGDLPVGGDFDGDGIADPAVFRPSTGVWYIEKSSGGFTILQFGRAGDAPVSSDFDGDGATDIAVFRESNGTWHWLNSSTSGYSAAQFGSPGDTPIQGDFDGDGIDDLSVFRNSTGVWYARLSSTGGYDIRKFGVEGDVPAAADFDGDEITDLAVFRPAQATWFIWNSSANDFRYEHFGSPGDLPSTSH